MIVTAHGGAMDTGRNTHKYLDRMAQYNVDAIEVDIRKAGKTLYLAHTPFDLLNPKKLKLSEAFAFVKETGKKINCDIKNKGLIKPVLDEARKIGVEDKVMFTGAVTPGDVVNLTDGCAYLNVSFFPFPVKKGNVKKIKEFMEKFNNPRLAGINVNYRRLTPEFCEECLRENVVISAFTIDIKEHIEKIVKYPAVYNVTTNIHHKALEILGRKVKI